MAVAEWASPILSFLGAAVGAWLVYRVGRSQEWGRRFQAAVELLASSDPRARALGRARMVEVARRGAGGENGRREALAVLREDVRASCPDDVWRALSAATTGAAPPVRIAHDGDTRSEPDGVYVSQALVDSAVAYVEVAGGPDAAEDQVVALIADVRLTSGQATIALNAPPIVDPSPSARPLPVDHRLILVKLNADALNLDANGLRERASKSWRLSLERLRSQPPDGVAAVVQQRVIGAWKFREARRSEELPDRVEFVLGDPIPDLAGCEYRDTGQNPVRYWP
jgi:hypothetical protein